MKLLAIRAVLLFISGVNFTSSLHLPPSRPAPALSPNRNFDHPLAKLNHYGSLHSPTFLFPIFASLYLCHTRPYLIIFSLTTSVVIHTINTSPTPANALPTAAHPHTQSNLSKNNIEIASTEMQTSQPSRRTVYNPHIISPAQGDNWKVGNWVEVIWFVTLLFQFCI